MKKFLLIMVLLPASVMQAYAPPSTATKVVAGTTLATAATGLAALYAQHRWKGVPHRAYQVNMARKLASALSFLTVPQLIGLLSLITYDNRHTLTTDNGKAKDIAYQVDDRTPDVKYESEEEKEERKLREEEAEWYAPKKTTKQKIKESWNKSAVKKHLFGKKKDANFDPESLNKEPEAKKKRWWNQINWFGRKGKKKPKKEEPKDYVLVE